MKSRGKFAKTKDDKKIGITRLKSERVQAKVGEAKKMADYRMKSKENTDKFRKSRVTKPVTMTQFTLKGVNHLLLLSAVRSYFYGSLQYHRFSCSQLIILIFSNFHISVNNLSPVYMKFSAHF